MSHRNQLLTVLTLASLLPAGCSAQDITPKSSQTLPATESVPHAAAPQTGLPTGQAGLFVKNDNLVPAYFESGKSQLDPKTMEALKSNVDWLKQNMPMQIQLAGFSDGRGTPEQNLAVGQRRAAALRDFYVAMGIPRSRLSTVTLGQEEPVCFETTDDCQAKNRRVETLIENKSLAAR